MTENEQIQEMAKDIRLYMQITPKPKEHPSHRLARFLIKDGYRKVERGEWKLIGNGNGRPIHWKCSVCGYETLDAANGDTNFCPNCGADMRGK